MTLTKKTMKALETGLDVLRSRFQLAGLEILKEQKRVTLLGLQAFWAMISIILLVQSGLILAWYFTPESSRWIFFAGVFGLSVLATIAGFWGIHVQISRKSPPLSATVRELERDVECLKSILK